MKIVVQPLVLKWGAVGELRGKGAGHAV